MPEDNEARALIASHTRRLAFAHGAIWIANSVFITAAPLAMYRLSGSTTWAGALLLVRFSCWAASARATGRLMDWVGRRPGLLFGFTALWFGSVGVACSIVFGLR